MPRERVLIAVKTYPALSGKYRELACTAGFREDGSWIRLYPIPFRLLEGDKQYKKYQWIEADIERNKADPRPESYKVNRDTISIQEEVSRERNWEARKRLILDKAEIKTDLSELISDAHNDTRSLAVFKPTSIDKFRVKKAPQKDSGAKLKAVLDSFKQANLFEDESEEFIAMPELPYRFYYEFRDEKGKSSTLMIEDWEIGQLYLNCVKKYGEQEALEKVEQRYMEEFTTKKDLYLFLGTTYKWHIRKARNPFVIIGVFYPPIEKQDSFIL
ncbi:MAG: hypothetical protein PQ612_09740 [Rickettsiales bacterium]|nr:hypothetical protein [Pseudomonadota bacterium]MDA0966075.1 hypothetical protein [Pseudomonadota bacterium]MDG4544257.1 hypothetical protein [Rickettsiales bacterium]MDG4546436.1 hypothetical protein [Rickettsiales bacterium]MDG4548582.1 hypothetical protein [Rickettsiales bacterium]